MPVHLSVQANTVNYAAVKFWKKLGISRVILSRELSLDQVAEIRQECPDMELEVFVHGALCIAYSGRCLLSGYFNHRDPNQGTCTNSCRWEFNTRPGKVGPDGDVFLLEEPEKRAGSHMPIEEDEHGTYILNSKDLRAIEHVQRLTEIGVDSLKIEGRTKSPYYVARTVRPIARPSTTRSPAARSTRPAARTGWPGQSRLHRRFLRTPPGSRISELPARPFRIRPQPVCRRCAGLRRRRAWRKSRSRTRFSVGDRIETDPPKVAPGNGHQMRIPLPAGYEGAFTDRGRS
jgi:U32 family peptidase